MSRYRRRAVRRAILVPKADSVEALMHLLKEPSPNQVAVFNGGKRYGGFRDGDHAAFFVNCMGWQDTAVIKLLPAVEHQENR